MYRLLSLHLLSKVIVKQHNEQCILKKSCKHKAAVISYKKETSYAVSFFRFICFICSLFLSSVRLFCSVRRILTGKHTKGILTVNIKYIFIRLQFQKTQNVRNCERIDQLTTMCCSRTSEGYPTPPPLPPPLPLPHQPYLNTNL